MDQDDDSYKRTMIHNFLTGMSTVSGMKISFNTMEVCISTLIYLCMIMIVTFLKIC